MKEAKKDRLFFALILAAFLVSACTPLSVPFALGSDGTLNTLGRITGVLFWSGLIGGVLGYILLSRKRKKVPETAPGEQKRSGRPPAPFRFFSTKAAVVTDTVMIFALAGVVFCALRSETPAPVAVVCLLLSLAGIYSHFIFNGNLYHSLRNEWTEHRPRRERKGREQ